jgi:NADH-quinone oxidoreductase subunit L
MEVIILLIPLIPLIGAVTNALAGGWLDALLGRTPEPEGHDHHPGPSIAGYVACAAVGLSFVFSLIVFSRVLEGVRFNVDYFDWIAVDRFHITFGFLIDPLSATMLLVVTGIGFLIHVYSLGYMAHDPDRPRFFTYMNLFIFSMLMLVMGNNFLVMFFGWEGVGLCSYLLIGFWYRKQSASDAGKKAFVVNRIGDFGFMIGMFLIFATFGSLHYDQVFEALRAHPNTFSIATTITGIGMLLFVGAIGKSAQIPLYVWLPDAMEGPTPVSALIHAATMVTAGVFMVARCNPIFSFDIGPAGHVLGMSAGDLVTYIGCGTALLAATIGLVQTDIKRVLAYSTVSQLGYMFIGVGVGAYSAGIFHLVTHAFFKALLFLGAGSVIHIMEHAFHRAGVHKDPQDIRNMGGLYPHARNTAVTFLIAWIAISGIPPFSGFFSKDEILSAAYHEGYGGVFWLGVLGAVLTAFYMSRLVFLTFFGESRTDASAGEHLRESPSVMTVPLMVLAFLAAVGGFIGVPEALGGGNWFGHFLAPTVGEHMAGEHHGLGEGVLIAISVLAGLTGIGAAYLMYMMKKVDPDKLAADYRPVYTTLLNKYYVDEAYDRTVVWPIRWASEHVLWKGVDVKVIDGLIYILAISTDLTGRVLRLFQTGYVQTYAFFISLGLALVIYYILK